MDNGSEFFNAQFKNSIFDIFVELVLKWFDLFFCGRMMKRVSDLKSFSVIKSLLLNFDSKVKFIL